MHINLNLGRKAAQIGLGCLISLAALTIVTGAALAGGNDGRHASGDSASGPTAFKHGAILRLSPHDPLPMHKSVQIGRHKSLLVELPRDIRDVLVSDPSVVDAVVQSSNRVFLVAKSKTAGQANAFFFDTNGEQILTLEINIDRDSGPLEGFLNKHITGASIKVEMLHETIVLTGSVRNPIDATRAGDIAQRFMVMNGATAEANMKYDKKVVNLLKVEGGEQVMLKVTVAEIQRTLLKQLGINLGAEINAGNFGIGMLTANQLPLTTAAGLGKLLQPGTATDQAFGAACKLVGDQLLPNVVGHGGPYGFWQGGGNCATAAMRFLERDGLVRTLAEPNYPAVSGETAKFLAGGEYPIPVVDGQGKVSVVYKEFGVGVSFTPVVFSEGRISLKIETEVSELTDSGAVTLSSINIPALKKRQANSTVELPSGGSIAMAGLISDDTRQNIDGTPGLKNLPVLGTLFRSRDFIKRETELVVIVTPYMVKPTSRSKLSRPDDGLAAASDLKANFLGHLNRVYGKTKELPVDGLKGDYGFIVK